jgi:5-methylcytosine-specific restriction endonuclease McrA
VSKPRAYQPRRACRYGHDYPDDQTTVGRHRVCPTCQAARKPRLCEVPSCGRKHYCQGHCSLHYNRMRRFGSLEAPIEPTVAERFWAKVDKDGPIPLGFPELGPCWTWTAFTYEGRSQFNQGDKLVAPRRWAWINANGPLVDPKLVILSRCRNSLCVRPSHAFPGSAAAKGRNSAWGQQTHCKAGHEFTPDNTRVKSNGHRQCRVCRRHRARQWRIDNPAAALQRSRRAYLRRHGGVSGFEYSELIRKDPCSYCGGLTESVDHIHPVSLGGNSDWDNLTAACQACNSGKRERSLLGYLLHRLTA